MYPLIKRLIDILIASLVLLVLLPLIIPILIGLRVTGEGEIFYLQKRVGYRNKYFNIWKFATMLKDSPNIGTGEITLRNDPRVTPMGKYLRMTKFNELPQIINVLKGDMSIVGPRPLTEKAYLAYPEDIRSYIYNAKPGITGIGSVVFRDEEEIISASQQDPHIFYREQIAPYKGQLELWYQKHRSTWVDLSLIFLTAWVILFPKSKLHFQLFKDLPKSHQQLEKVQ
ncbi:MAG: sugar transferase [Cyanothece sp. SIO1E1]|nr:sugar transferase [Cyanothece sp. SIO1E1]